MRRLAPHIPELQRVRDEEAISRLTSAPDRSRLVRPDVDAELGRRLAADPVVTISGIGGLGKSAAAATYAADKEDDFDLVIWLDPGEVRRPEDLQALTLLRAGGTRNVAALLRTRACLLVIDDADPGLSAQDLSGLCGPRSRIILTQRAVTPASYQLPLLAHSEAQDLLGSAGEACPPQYFEVIVGGHPLSLALISAAARQGASWADIIVDCQAVGEFEDRGQPRRAHRPTGC